jgi:hypothetical protein
MEAMRADFELASQAKDMRLLVCNTILAQITSPVNQETIQRVARAQTEGAAGQRVRRS